MLVRNLICFALAMCLSSAYSQSKQDPNELRIGLVLSGGGAKCLSQIGVLEVMDSLGIKVDYIAGTSMGAIIGGMYALGYSGKEIGAYFKETDWDALLTNEIPRNRLGYFDRKASDRYLINFDIYDGKPHLPQALNYSQYILKQLSLLTMQSYQYQHFADFPIPFLCVATDLENGDLKVFEDGRLLDALRASSAFPSLFTPYELDDHLYVDGGVINNYPVRPLLSRGMNYIIGIDVQDVLYKKEELTSVIQILEQTSSFIKAEASEKQLKATNLVIQPDVPEIGMTTFDQFDYIVEAGRREARSHIDDLLAIRKAGADTVEPPAANIMALPLPEIYVDSVVVNGSDQTTRNFVLGKMRIRDNELITLKKLDRGMDRLYGSRYYQNIDYTVLPSDTGYHLLVKVQEAKSLAQFRIGLNYNDDFDVALLLNYTKRNLLFRNSLLTFDFAAGQEPRVDLNYFVDRGFIPTLGIKFRANRFDLRIYQDLNALTELVYTDFSLNLYVQSTIRDALAVGGGIQVEGVDISESLNIIGVSNTYQNYLNYYGFLDFDSFDDGFYPRAGSKFSLNGRIINRLEQVTKEFEPSSVFDATVSQAFHFGEKFSGSATLTGIGTIGPGFNDDFAYNIYLGSAGKDYINYIQPFIGYRFMELAGRNALTARADLYFEFFRNHYLVFKGNIGKLQPSFGELFSSEILLDGYGLAYSFDSPIGPLEFTVMGSSNHGNVYSYLSLGFWF